MGAHPQSPDSFSTATQVAATQPNTPVGEICEPCAARFRVEAHYNDPWKTPITLAPLRVQYREGAVISEGGRTRALATFGLQDGEPIQSVLPEVGAYDDRAPEPGAITAHLVPEDAGDPAALEEQIVAELAAFAQTMETAMQPWIIQWEADGWLGLFGSLWGSLKSGASAWWEGEGEFWGSVGEWLSNLPDMLGDAWDSLSESAKALWENRDQILALLQNLAEGSVAAFEAGLEAIARALQSIPGLEEIAQLLHDLVEESAEWAGAMIEMATQTRVLAVLGGTMLGTMMMIPPNFWSDMVGLGVGYLIPELFIAIVLAIIAFFTAGTGGAALAARIATYTAKVTKALSSAGRAGRALLRVFSLLKSISAKMVDLIKALKGKIDEIAEGATDAIIRITRRVEPAKMKPGIREHIRDRDMTVPRKRGIGGAHNKDVFERALKDEGGEVVSRTPHPTIPGVEKVEYRLPQLDAAGNPTGRMQKGGRPKTIYDPEIISDNTMMRWGQEAADSAMRKHNGILPHEWRGTSKDGNPIYGYADQTTNEVTSFFPEM